jgi:hypothetical protein
MQESLTINKVPHLADIGNVIPEEYNYYRKRFTPGEPLILKRACFKWYNLYPDDAEIKEDNVLEAKRFLESEEGKGNLVFNDELGFIILHRAGDYLLLLVTTWRLTNEMWESIFLKKAGVSENYKPLKFDNDHKGTYCVWELGAVWHERNAWIRFIESKRDEEAKLVYLNDLFNGEI